MTGDDIYVKRPQLFRPGQSGCPTGKPPLPPEIKALAKLTREKLVVLLNHVVNLTESQAVERLKDPEVTLLQKGLIQVILKAAQEGDPKRLEFLFDRLVGKVDIGFQVTSSLKDLSTEELVKLAKEKIQIVEAGFKDNTAKAVLTEKKLE